MTNVMVFVLGAVGAIFFLIISFKTAITLFAPLLVFAFCIHFMFSIRAQYFELKNKNGHLKQEEEELGAMNSKAATESE